MPLHTFEILWWHYWHDQHNVCTLLPNSTPTSVREQRCFYATMWPQGKYVRSCVAIVYVAYRRLVLFFQWSVVHWEAHSVWCEYASVDGHSAPLATQHGDWSPIDCVNLWSKGRIKLWWRASLCISPPLDYYCSHPRIIFSFDCRFTGMLFLSMVYI